MTDYIIIALLAVSIILLIVVVSMTFVSFHLQLWKKKKALFFDYFQMCLFVFQETFRLVREKEGFAVHL